MSALVPLLLRLQLTLQRMSLLNMLAFILLLSGAGAWLIWLPHIRQQNTTIQTALTRVEQALRAPPTLAPVAKEEPQSDVKNLDQFYDTLGEEEYVEQQVKLLFALAKKVGLTLQQGEYKASFERQGRFHKYQIVLPVKGSYGLIRQFSESVLKGIPFASLDELSFKRDHISNRVLEAKLRFTLYLTSETSKPEKAS
jgi:hypothetical protein